MNQEPPTSREEALSGLRRILQALALSGERQKALFPDFLVLGEGLALEFDDGYHAVVGNRHDLALPAEGRALLAEIDASFDRMVDAHEHVWSAEGVAERQEWATMRRLAAQALQALGWPEGDPSEREE